MGDGVGATVARTRSCDRPGCAARAEVLLVMNGGATAVHLRPMVDPPPPLTLALCTPHADRLQVPRGWVLHDERAEGRLFIAAAPKRKRRPRGKAATDDALDGPEGAGGAVASDTAESSVSAAVALATAPEPDAAQAPLFGAPGEDATSEPEPEPEGESEPLLPSVPMPPPERRLLHRAFRGAAGPDPVEPRPSSE